VPSALIRLNNPALIAAFRQPCSSRHIARLKHGLDADQVLPVAGLRPAGRSLFLERRKAGAAGVREEIPQEVSLDLGGIRQCLRRLVSRHGPHGLEVGRQLQLSAAWAAVRPWRIVLIAAA
jgi:hypothetical protein